MIDRRMGGISKPMRKNLALVTTAFVGLCSGLRSGNGRLSLAAISRFLPVADISRLRVLPRGEVGDERGCRRIADIEDQKPRPVGDIGGIPRDGDSRAVGPVLRVAGNYEGSDKDGGKGIENVDHLKILGARGYVEVASGEAEGL